MDLRINETLQTGAVANRTYQVRGESVYLFFEFTIVRSTFRSDEMSIPTVLYSFSVCVAHAQIDEPLQDPSL